MSEEVTVAAPLSTRAATASRWFARLWAVAVLAHLVGNPRFGLLWPDPTGHGVAIVALGLAAAGLLVAPSHRRLLAVVAALTILVAWFEAPFLGNHWLLAALVSVAILVSLTRPDPWAWLAPTARWMLLGFYGFAAFAKLNTGFFDPTASCGVFYANQSLGAAGMPTIPVGGAAAAAVAVSSAAVELAVPVLLAVPATRRVGVVVAMAFHFLVSLDLAQHFYDFTAVLYPLFALFLADETLGRLESRARLRGRLAAGLVGTVTALVVLSVAPPIPGVAATLSWGAFGLWVPFGLWVLVATVRAGGEGARRALRLPSWAAAGLVAVVLFNGLTPYLELKTGYGWNMYSNLVTVDGESNHLIVRRTLPLTDAHRGLVEVLESSDPGLAQYVESGYALTERQFRHYLADHPEATVVYRQRGVVRTGTGAELGERLPLLAAKLQLFRAVDLERPPRCQAAWLPAY